MENIKTSGDKFAHLNVHSEYSMRDGMASVSDLCKTAADMGMEAIALTDSHNLFATIKFYSAALQTNIKPIIGATVFIDHPRVSTTAQSMTLLSMNQAGYDNLKRVITKSYMDGYQGATPTIALDWLTQARTQGLLLLTGGVKGCLGDVWRQSKNQLFDVTKDLLSRFAPSCVYLEVTRTGVAEEAGFNQAMVQLAQSLDLPLVATKAVRFLCEDDFEAHEARVCVQQGRLLADENRPKDYTSAQYLKPVDDMCELFADLPDAVANTNEIAKRCTNVIEFGNVYLPKFPTPEKLSVAQTLEKFSSDGLSAYIEKKHITEDIAKLYLDRMHMELGVINTMGYAGYFLIVSDFIQWSKSKNIPVGPGRGSGAGSLIAFVLGITALDPLKYDLLFERFLNPERVSMPDFDIDFCMEGRDDVIAYVTQTYGAENVSQIITYGTMSAKAVIRDIGRVLGFPYGFVDKLAKLIPNTLGITLAEAMESESKLQARYEDEEGVRQIYDLASKLEGVVRNASKHAGGVVIAPSNLTDYTALYREDENTIAVTQFDKDDVETVGLVKFDFLGLRTLTIINWTVNIVNEQRKTLGLEPLQIEDIPLDDEATFKLLQACTTSAVFQLESRGMKDLIKRLQPDSFEEIIALVALFRPGPLQSGMVDDFVDRKHGRSLVQYPHPKLEKILSPTYGVILYQEQVMQIAQELAGYTLGHADLLRRAMGKKKHGEMAKQRTIFTSGAVQNGIEVATASYIFDLMEKFAGYGFNKSHSAAYALIAYQTAWLKCHHPSAFMAAVLSSDMDNTDKIVTMLEASTDIDIDVLSPDINRSDYRFSVCDDKRIRFGLGAIKGVGKSAIDCITQARADGPYKDLYDFCERADTKKINRRTLEALIKSGAMDCFEIDRATLLATVERALVYAEQTQKNRSHGQHDLFAVQQTDSSLHAPSYVEVESWSKSIRLQGEKASLGFYLSGHPIDDYRDELQSFTTIALSDIQTEAPSKLTIAGYVTGVRKMFTKRGDRMAFVTIDDNITKMDFTVFSECFDESQDLLTEDTLVVVKASSNSVEDKLRLTAEKIFSITEARARYQASLVLDFQQAQADTQTISKIKTLLSEQDKGANQIIIHYHQPKWDVPVILGNKWKVSLTPDLVEQFDKILGSDNTRIHYPNQKEGTYASLAS